MKTASPEWAAVSAVRVSDRAEDVPETSAAPEVSVVIPAYRAASHIDASVRALAEALAAAATTAEILVVDDGSDDGTAEVAAKVEGELPPDVVLKVLRLASNRGKGFAVRRGLEQARGRYLVFVDADLQYPPESVLALIDRLRRSADVVVASRAETASRIELPAHRWASAVARHAASRAFSGLVRVLLLPDVSDTQAGLKGLTATAAERLLPRLSEDRFGFDIELLVAARSCGLRVVQMPVFVRASRSPSRVDFLLDGLDLLGAVARVALRRAVGRYGAGRAPRFPAPPVPRSMSPQQAAWRLLTAALIGVAASLWMRSRSPWLALGLWAAALAAVLAAAAAADGDNRGWRPPLRRCGGEWALLGMLIAAAGLMRLVGLDRVPPMIHGDSAECGLRGLELLAGRADPLGMSDWYWTPYVSFLPYALSFALGGVVIAALRLPSALAGTAVVPFLYFLTRRWFGGAAAVVAAVLYAFFHPAVHFSRIGLWNIQVALLAVVSLAAAEGAVVRRSRFLAALSGLGCGLALYAYTAGRMVPPLAVLLLGGHALRRRSEFGQMAALGLTWVVAFSAAFAPMAHNMIRQPEILHDDRTYAVSVFAPINRPHVEATLGRSNATGILLEQTRRTLAGFVSMGDQSTQYGSPQPLFSPLGIVWLLVGAAAVSRRLFAPGPLVLLAWLGGGLVLGSVLVIDPPSHTRLVVLLPALCIAFGASIGAAWRWASAWLAGRGARTAAAFLLAAVVAGEVIWNVRGYARFVEAMRAEPREWDAVRAFEEAKPAEDYYLFTGPFMMADAPFFRLFLGRVRAVTGFTERDLPRRLNGDTVFVLMPEYRRIAIEIERRFPGAERRSLRREGRPQVLWYRCAADNGCRVATGTAR